MLSGFWLLAALEMCVISPKCTVAYRLLDTLPKGVYAAPDACLSIVSTNPVHVGVHVRQSIVIENVF